jgi:hypothetical protein
MRIVALLALACLSTAAAAQLRTIPKEAKLGQMRHLQEMVVELDGKPQLLAPGAQIRDPENRLVVPSAMVEKQPVGYLVDGTGQVFRVWILSAREKALLPKSPVPKSPDK